MLLRTKKSPTQALLCKTCVFFNLGSTAVIQITEAVLVICVYDPLSVRQMMQQRRAPKMSKMANQQKDRPIEASRRQSCDQRRPYNDTGLSSVRTDIAAFMKCIHSVLSDY